MKRTAALILALITALVTVAHSQETKTTSVDIVEPAVYDLAELFKVADVVALVNVRSGDAEHYDSAVYKAEVIRSFKGVKAGDIIYFGPFIGTKIGDEYILFLKNSKESLAPKSAASPYGVVVFHYVFDEGYSSMEKSYECAFKGKEIAQECDYGIRVCTDYIKLPRNTETAPPLDEGTPFGCRRVRLSVFEPLLERLSKP